MNGKPDNRDAVPTAKQDTVLDGRQSRERDYHAEFAQRHRDRVTQPVRLDVIEPGPRRPWNGHWASYDLLMAESILPIRLKQGGLICS
jgi:hypothetical protein